jgi:hypothetical protein
MARSVAQRPGRAAAEDGAADGAALAMGSAMNPLSAPAIVCGFDLSTSTDDVVDIASRLAKSLGDRVVLVHATPVALTACRLFDIRPPDVL